MRRRDPEEKAGGIFTAATNISAEGRANRAILSAAMEQAGVRGLPDGVLALVVR